MNNNLKFIDGKFKILIISDIQDTHDLQPDTLKLINAGLDKVKPNLVVLLGDNVADTWQGVNKEKVKIAIDSLLKPINQRNLPFALVFGNHDRQTGVDNYQQMLMYKKYSNCLAEFNDYNLLIYDSQNQKPLFNLFFIDSNSNCKNPILSEYDYVHTNQIKWYENKVDEIKNNFGLLPSFVFQHMPVCEIYKGLKRLPLWCKNAVRGQTRNNIFKYRINKKSYIKGSLCEAPCPPSYNNGQFSSWKKKGDVISAFFGHDHNNDIEMNIDNIKLIQTTGAGFFAYGNGEYHGVREIVLYENDLLNFETNMLYFKDIVGSEFTYPNSAFKGYDAGYNR